MTTPYGGQPGSPDDPYSASPPPRTRSKVPFLIAGLGVVAIVLTVVAWLVTRDDPRTEAERFLTALHDGRFGDARDLLCQDGKNRIGNGDELRTQIDLADKQLAGYTVTAVTDTEYLGDKRTNVDADVRYSNGRNGKIILSMVKERGHFLVCGFQ